MKPLIRIGITILLVVGGAWYGATAYNKLKVEDEHKAEILRIQKDWLERANWVNDVAQADAYQSERAALDRWYFDELAAHYKHYPEFKDFYRVEHTELSGKNPLAKKKYMKGTKVAANEDLDLKREYYGLVKGVFDSLKDGSYHPAYTAASNSLRFDLYKVGKATSGKGFRFDIVLWGAQRKLEREVQPAGNVITRMNASASFSGLNFKFFDEKGKVAAEMPVTGEPEIKVDYPERWIEEFPPQAIIGYYELPPVPANAVKMQVETTVTSRSLSGNEIPATFKFEMPVEPDWRLAPGEAWEGAQTEERPKEYIEGKAENP